MSLPATAQPQVLLLHLLLHLLRPLLRVRRPVGDQEQGISRESAGDQLVTVGRLSYGI